MNKLLKDFKIFAWLIDHLSINFIFSSVRSALHVVVEALDICLTDQLLSIDFLTTVVTSFKVFVIVFIVES